MRFLAAAPLAAVPWIYPFSSGPSPQVQPWLASMACGIGLWALAGTQGRTHRLPAALAACMGAVVAWAFLSAPTVRPEGAMLAAGLALVLLSAGAATDRRLAGGLQGGTLGAAVLTALLGLCQYFGLAPGLAPWVSQADAGIAYANLRQTNQYATFCWIGAALVLWAPLRLPLAGRMVLVALLAIGNAASASRTGMLEGGVLLVLALVWRGPDRRERLRLCAVAAAAYGAGVVVLPLLLEALTGREVTRALWTRFGGDGCSSRLVLWGNVLRMIGERPLTGWGWGELDYAHYVTLYEDMRFCEILDNAHNLPLHLAVELGVPAMLLILGAAIVWAWRQRPWNEDDPLRRVAWAVLALVALHSLLEYPLWYGPFQVALGLALGWLMAVPAAPAAARPWSRVRVAVVLLVGLGYATWDYARVSQVYLQPQQRRAAWADDTLAHVRRSWLFSGQAGFADLTLATPERANAVWMHGLAQRVLHYSPEPRVVERAIESATLLGRTEEAVLHLARYRAAFPQDYEAWRSAQRRPLAP